MLHQLLQQHVQPAPVIACAGAAAASESLKEDGEMCLSDWVCCSNQCENNICECLCSARLACRACRVILQQVPVQQLGCLDVSAAAVDVTFGLDPAHTAVRPG